VSPRARPVIVIGQGDGVAMVRVPLFARRTLAYVVRTQFGDRHQQFGPHPRDFPHDLAPARLSLVWACTVLDSEIPLANGVFLPLPVGLHLHVHPMVAGAIMTFKFSSVGVRVVTPRLSSRCVSAPRTLAASCPTSAARRSCRHPNRCGRRCPLLGRLEATHG
jgi:hypothetical protein